jgi:hypothetical protein
VPPVSRVVRALLAAARLTPAAAAMVAVVAPSPLLAASAARTASSAPPAAGPVPGRGLAGGAACAALGGVAGFPGRFLVRVISGLPFSGGILLNAG